MKKVILFFGVLFIGASFTSCSKDRNCNCTNNITGSTTTVVSGSDAQEQCDAILATQRFVDPTATCTLD